MAKRNLVLKLGHDQENRARIRRCNSSSWQIAINNTQKFKNKLSDGRLVGPGGLLKK